MSSQVEVTVPGEWFARPANEPSREWPLVTATPAPVQVKDGEVYRFRADYQVTDEQLQGLAKLRDVASLQELDLGNCNNLTDAGLVHLRDLTQLRHLDIQWCQQITDAGLAHLSRLTNLQDLNLTWVTEMTDAGLSALTGLTQLKFLALDCCWNVTGEAAEAFRAKIPACVLEGA